MTRTEMKGWRGTRWQGCSSEALIQKPLWTPCECTFASLCAFSATMVESEVRGSTPKGSGLCFTSGRSEVVLDLQAAMSHTLRVLSVLSYNAPPSEAPCPSHSVLSVASPCAPLAMVMISSARASVTRRFMSTVRNLDTPDETRLDVLFDRHFC